MSETSGSALRLAVKDVVESDVARQQERVIETVAQREDVPAQRVEDELQRMERNGFVYIVNGEVKLP